MYRFVLLPVSHALYHHPFRKLETILSLSPTASDYIVHLSLVTTLHLPRLAPLYPLLASCDVPFLSHPDPPRSAMAEPATSTSNTSTAAASDPYVIYQLRKPSQRGTAVIPRFVPNTHAPAFSPANYRFARVWANDSNAQPNSFLNVPRSFDYAGSLGSESSFWSDTSSWVSVSSLRTAQSDHRQPLLHASSPPKVSAAAFFNNDYPLSSNPLRSHSTRSSEIDQQPAFHYPPALSESLSEDAVIDDLLATRVPQYPTISTPSPSPRPTPNPSNQHQYSTKQSTRSPTRSGLLPALTRKRRSLWQWLFCSDQAAASTTVPSVTVPPSNSSRQKERAVDRVPGGDKDFLTRAHKAKDAPKPKRRSPSFELRRGKPERETSRRSMSWTFVPKALLGRDQKRRKPPSTKPVVNEDVLKENKLKRSKKKKDRPRGLVDEELDEGRAGGKLTFAKAFVGLDTAQVKRSEGRRDVVRRDDEKPKRHQDRPREDRPRKSSQPQSKKNVSVAPVQKSVVPSLREKKGVGSMPGLTQRMRSADSSDPVTSRISSDLSSTLERSMGSRSGDSTPVHMKTYQVGGHEFDPAANGVSSDVSSHENSGLQSKSSPSEQISVPEVPDPPIRSGGIDFSTINAARASRNPQLRSELFAFPSSSTESGGFFGPSDYKSWENPHSAYPEYTNAENLGASSSTEADATMFDPVARALEKNRLRSGGGPLSYLMPEQDLDVDADTQSTGLTSLADESVSTHKTVSAVGDDYRLNPPSTINVRNQRGDPRGNAKQLQEHRDDMSDSSGSVQAPHIFKNSALFSSNRSFSPSRLSNSSPRRFHSDWSDPHATDIERFCQCRCDCVYEEECRRTCELVYGRRSPSVSSTRSNSRRVEFQSLSPEAEDTELSSKRKTSVTQSSNEPANYNVGRNLNGRAVEERRVYSEKRYAQVPGADEPFGSCSHRRQSTSSPYDPSASDNANHDMKTRDIHRYEENNSESERNRGRTQQYEDRPRGERRDGYAERSSRHYKDSSKPSHSSWSRTQQSDEARTMRKHESRHLQDSQQDARTGSKEQRSRPSSRNTSSSRQSSGYHKEHYGNGRGRHGDLSDANGAERRRREIYERRKYGSSEKRSDGAQQMGNSYVLKRDGPPPFNQSNYPQPYKGNDYDKEFEYESRDQGKVAESGGTKRRTRDTSGGRHDLYSSVARGSVPIVELEYDEKRMGSPDMYKSDASKSKEKVRDGRFRNGATRLEMEKRKGLDNGRHGTRRAANEQHHGLKGKGETKSSAKPTPRHHAKGSNHGRALFGLF